MDISIREATPKDYEGLCRLIAEVDAQHSAALPHIFRTPGGPARTREFIDEILANESAVLFVAEEDRQAVGLVLVFVREARDIPIFTPRRYAVIDDLVVKKERRRCGIGKALLDKAHQWASSQGATQIELNVWEFNNEAIAFYGNLGYETASRKMWKDVR